MVSSPHSGEGKHPLSLASSRVEKSPTASDIPRKQQKKSRGRKLFVRWGRTHHCTVGGIRGMRARGEGPREPVAAFFARRCSGTSFFFCSPFSLLFYYLSPVAARVCLERASFIFAVLFIYSTHLFLPVIASFSCAVQLEGTWLCFASQFVFRGVNKDFQFPVLLLALSS